MTVKLTITIKIDMHIKPSFDYKERIRCHISMFVLNQVNYSQPAALGDVHILSQILNTTNMCSIVSKIWAILWVTFQLILQNVFHIYGHNFNVSWLEKQFSTSKPDNSILFRKQNLLDCSPKEQRWLPSRYMFLQKKYTNVKFWEKRSLLLLWALWCSHIHNCHSGPGGLVKGGLLSYFLSKNTNQND